ncbi:hypothetical protein H0H81_009543, partial [Sphagnurus paluster]
AQVEDTDLEVPAFSFGGLPSGDEEDEHIAAKKGIHYRSVAKIEVIQSAPITPKPIQRQKKARERFNHNDLPRDTLENFKKLVIPIACNTVAALNPWDSLTDVEFADTWNLVFHETHLIQVDLTPGSLFLVIKALVCSGFSVKLLLTSTYLDQTRHIHLAQ